MNKLHGQNIGVVELSPMVRTFHSECNVTKAVVPPKNELSGFHQCTEDVIRAASKLSPSPSPFETVSQ